MIVSESSIFSCDQSLLNTNTKTVVNNDISGCHRSTHFSDEEYINIHNQIFLSGRYNFEGRKISLDSNLNIEFFRFMLKG